MYHINSFHYRICSTRKFIDKRILPTDNFKTRWVKELPIKINILMWRVAKDRLHVRSNLALRGIDIQDTSCPICSVGVESSNHIFFVCNLALEIWRKLRIWMDINIHIFTNQNDWICWFDSWARPNTSKVRIYSIVAAHFWVIWRYRNGVVFQDEVLKKGDLFDQIRSISYVWFDQIRSISYVWLFYRCKDKLNWNNWLLKPL
ncbi:uncharacterized protein [Rutidosis leptorrhynchoides]|uniref:uncharacterized protein n=1 Tax=Rutidosis leptorrhynchoides TaxID=125765 RepID=UPI003A996E0E